MKEITIATNYKITEDGLIYKDGRRINSVVDTSRYHRVGLIDNKGVRKKFLVHRLVAITYIPNPENKPEVNHKDGNKLNNHVENLEWVSRRENMSHAFKTGLNSNLGSLNGKAILNEEQVILIYQALLEGQLEKDLAIRFGVTKEIVKKVKYKASWGHILKDYPEVPVKHKSKSISDGTANWVCQKLQEGLKVKEILDITTNERLSFDIIYDIRRKRSFKHISCNYNW